MSHDPNETAPDLALRPPPVHHQPGPEYHESQRQWQGIPAIEQTAGGRLWAAWYTGGRTEDPDNHIVLVTSTDEGQSWSQPVLAIDPPGRIRAADPVLWIDPLQRLWLFWMQSACRDGNPFDGRGGVWGIHCSDPDRRHPAWTPPSRVAHGVMMNKPTVAANGDWLLPTAVWRNRSNRPRAHTLPDEEFSQVTRSTDHGETFHRLGRAGVPERTVDEHMIVERRDGSLWMLVRRSDGVGEAVSADGGKTWQANRAPVFPGPNSRFHIRRLRSGRLMMINHHEFTGRSHLTAMLSEDDGMSWPHKLLLDERHDVSYPDAVESPDGRIHIIYDRCRVGHGEILLQTLTENEIIENRSPGHEAGRLKVISRIERAILPVGQMVRIGESLIDVSKNAKLTVHAPRVAEEVAGPPGNSSRVGEGHRWSFSSGGQDLGLVDEPEEPPRTVGKEGVSIPASQDGELWLKPVHIAGNQLTLDFSTEPGGWVKVEMQNWSGQAIEGFTFDDCPQLAGDHRAYPVAWKAGHDLSRFSGELVRLRFRMSGADLFGFMMVS